MQGRRLVAAAAVVALASVALPAAAMAAPGVWPEQTHVGPYQAIDNSAHQFRLELDRTGYLKLFDQVNRTLWSSSVDRPMNRPAGYAQLVDGELTVRSRIGTGSPELVWSSHTGGNPGARLHVQDDGNVVIYARDGRPIWATHTVYNTLAAPSHLDPTQNLVSSRDRFRLVNGRDGNVVMYNQETGRPVFATHTAGCGGTDGARFSLRSDGDLLVTSRADGHVCWSSHTSGHDGARLSLYDNGELVADVGRHPYWTSTGQPDH
jgi:hypothetical protein